MLLGKHKPSNPQDVLFAITAKLISYLVQVWKLFSDHFDPMSTRQKIYLKETVCVSIKLIFIPLNNHLKKDSVKVYVKMYICK